MTSQISRYSIKERTPGIKMGFLVWSLANLPPPPDFSYPGLLIFARCHAGMYITYMYIHYMYIVNLRIQFVLFAFMDSK